MLSDAQPSSEFIRVALKRAIVKMALKAEYDHIEPGALDVLVEMFFNIMGNIGFLTTSLPNLARGHWPL